MVQARRTALLRLLELLTSQRVLLEKLRDKVCVQLKQLRADVSLEGDGSLAYSKRMPSPTRAKEVTRRPLTTDEGAVLGELRWQQDDNFSDR